MKEVGHAASEDAIAMSGLIRLPIPFEWWLPIDGPHRAIERHPACPLHDGADVTAMTFCGDLVATPPKIHGVVGPADL
jgi:hypothetical protein